MLTCSGCHGPLCGPLGLVWRSASHGGGGGRFAEKAAFLIGWVPLPGLAARGPPRQGPQQPWEPGAPNTGRSYTLCVNDLIRTPSSLEEDRGTAG